MLTRAVKYDYVNDHPRKAEAMQILREFTLAQRGGDAETQAEEALPGAPGSEERKELLDFVIKMAGYIITGHCNENIMAMLLGLTARNGKGLFMRILKNVLEWMCATLVATLLTAVKAHVSTDAASPRTAALNKARCGNLGELPLGSVIDQDQFEILAGGDRMAARKLNADIQEFDPSHTIVMGCNELPVLKMDVAVKDKLIIIPFDAEFRAEKGGADGRQYDPKNPFSLCQGSPTQQTFRRADAGLL